MCVFLEHVFVEEDGARDVNIKEEECEILKITNVERTGMVRDLSCVREGRLPGLDKM